MGTEDSSELSVSISEITFLFGGLLALAETVLMGTEESSEPRTSIYVIKMSLSEVGVWIAEMTSLFGGLLALAGTVLSGTEDGRLVLVAL